MLSPVNRICGELKVVPQQARGIRIGCKTGSEWCYQNELLPDWMLKPYLLMSESRYHVEMLKNFWCCHRLEL